MSGDGRLLEVAVIAPDRVGFRGGARAVVAPAHDGQIGILYGHAPMTVLLGEGELRVREGEAGAEGAEAPAGGLRRFRVARGFLQVVDNRVSVLAEEVEPLD